MLTIDERIGVYGMRKREETSGDKLEFQEKNKNKMIKKFQHVFNKKGRSLFILLLLAVVFSSAAIYFNISNSSDQKKAGNQYSEKSGQENENTSDIQDVAANNQKTNNDVFGGNTVESESGNVQNQGSTEDINNTIDINNTDKNSNNSQEDDINTNGSDTDSSSLLQETFGQDNRKAVKVRGIYVSGPRAGSETYMKELVDLVDTTELNAMVIDIKNDLGEVTYNMNNDVVKDLKANRNYIKNIKALVSELKEKDIYLIARIVAFKDPILAEGKPELSIKMKDGSIFRDKNGDSWVNPYNKEVWDYLVSIGKEAAELGFDEIQFDYIRFSTDTAIKNADFGDAAKGKTKMDVITEFTKYACENLKPLGVYVSADVFGTIIDSETDAKIVGQDYKEMAKYLDYICPMIYPSHYQDGSYGIKHPDLEPYQLIYKALEKSQEVLGDGEGDGEQAEVRSWLQDFTATWLDNHKTYGAKEIKDQIQAVYDAGYDEWILWNGSNNYTKDGLIKDE